MEPILDDFKNSLERLKEVLVEKSDAIIRDSAIKRFELCFDLAWKSIKSRAKKEGLECYSPRACFKTAFQLELVENDELWPNMIEDRNRSVHIYSEQSADKIYSHLGDYYRHLKKLFKKLTENEEEKS